MDDTILSIDRLCKRFGGLQVTNELTLVYADGKTATLK